MHVKLTEADCSEARGMSAAGMSTRKIAAAFKARGKHISHTAIQYQLKKPPAEPGPPPLLTAPVDIEGADDLALELAAHRAARDGWMAMIRKGNLKPEELERAQKGLVRAGDAIRRAQLQLGRGTDENPETAHDWLMARFDEMAERAKRPRAVPAEAAAATEETTDQTDLPATG